jgi:hypothetical protein
MLLAAVICAVPGVAIALPGGIAGAELSSPVVLTVTCSSLRGGEINQIISGCTGSGAIASEAGAPPAHGSEVASTQVINWSNNKISRLKYTWTDRTGQNNTCPSRSGYTRDQQTIQKGAVITPGSTTKGLIGSAVRATLCVYKLAQAPHTILVINQGKISI